MRDTYRLQPVDCRCALCRVGTDQRAGGRNKNGIVAVGLGPGEDVVHAPFGQRWINQAETCQEVSDNARVYYGPALPWLRRRGVRRRVARERLNQPSARACQANCALLPQAAAARASRSALAPRAVVAVPATIRSINAVAWRGGKQSSAARMAVLSPLS